MRKKTPPTRKDDPTTAFPAPPATPGQKASRDAYAIFLEKRATFPWWEGYLDLRAEKWDWRKAAYMAWMAVPTSLRQPETLEKLCSEVLGINNSSTVRKWRAKQPEMERRIETLKVATLGDALSDVIEAWKTVAKTPDHLAHRDRITYLETMGVYKQKLEIEDWRSKLVEGLREGDLKPEEVRKELGDDLAGELFVTAGLPRDAGRQAVSQGEAAED